MSDQPTPLFVRKQRLVALLKAQLALLRQADPDGLGAHLDAVKLDLYDSLLAGGPSVRWPAGMLPGLRQGIRDLQHVLVLAYGAARRRELLESLREAAGDAIAELEADDAKRLATILKRGRTRTEDEYYLIRAEIDRMEIQQKPDARQLQRLREIADAAMMG
jgi:hypothetical protein